MTGPYFAIEGPPGDPDDWLTLATLASDPVALRGKVAVTASALGTDELRVAASIDFQGVAARVLSPAIRSAVIDGTVPVLDPHLVWWQPVVPGPMRLAWDDARRRPTSAPAVLAAVVRPALIPLLTAYRATFALSPQVLRGNLASALNGIVAVLPAASVLVRGLLDLDELADTALVPPPRFVRNSCCLYYRLPGTGICGDCVLTTRR